MEDQLPQITDSEWVVMKVIWEKAPLMNRDILERVGQKSKWNNKTIETLLRRLIDKKAVGYRLVGAKLREYYPLVSRDECIQVESETFLQKIYDGSVSMMMASFLKHQKLSSEELNRLKKLIDENNE